MKQQYLFDSIPNDKYDLLSKEEVVQLNKDNENLIRQMKDHIDQLHSKYLASEQKSFLLEEQTIIVCLVKALRSQTKNLLWIRIKKNRVNVFCCHLNVTPT